MWVQFNVARFCSLLEICPTGHVPGENINTPPVCPYHPEMLKAPRCCPSECRPLPCHVLLPVPGHLTVSSCPSPELQGGC